MSIQSTSFNPLLSQQASFNPTISSLDAGNVFDGQGNDFLSPKDILSNVDDFSGSINFGGGDAFGKNPSAKAVLTDTNSSLDDILNGSFGVNLAAPIAPSPFVAGAVPVTAVGFAPVATNTTVLAQAVQTPSPALIRDLSNFNPMIWQNPNPSNILLGTMDAQNKIFGGSGIFQPPVFNQYPLYPFIAPPSAPYSGFNISIPGFGGVTNAQQAQFFPTTFVTGSPFFNTSIQPFAVATTQTLIPYQVQVGLAELILGRSGALSSQLLGSLAPVGSSVSSNGVPPWISA
jgi:hypothetical protein